MLLCSYSLPVIILVEIVIDFRRITASECGKTSFLLFIKFSSTRVSSSVYRLVQTIPIFSPVHNPNIPIQIVISGKCTDSWLTAVIEPGILLIS